MNANYLAVKSKLPEHVIASLESKRGNVAELNELLEMYRKNGFTTEADNVFLMQEFMIPAEQKAARAQTDAAEERAFMEVFEKVKRKALLQQELKKSKSVAPTLLWSIILFLVAFCFLFIAIDTEIKEVSEFADNTDSIIFSENYYIENATIIGEYAEYYQARENDITNYKHNHVKFYLAEIKSSDGSEYLVSISVDLDSDIGQKLDAIDFEENTYVLSGYFSPTGFSNYKSDKSDENVGMIYDEAMEFYSIFGYESINNNFEYLCSSEADYMKDEKEEKVKNVLISLAIAATAAFLLFIAIKGIKNTQKIKGELYLIDADLASKKASVTNPANLQQ